MAAFTRNNTEIWLIGQPITNITGSKLPSNGDVLRRLFYCIRVQGITLKEASKIVLIEVKNYWEKARIPIIADYNAIPKFENQYNKWRALLKGKCRQSEPQKHKQTLFIDQLDDLFDIAHADALNLLTIEDDKAFLLAQRKKGRQGYMGGADKAHTLKETRKQQRVAAEDNRLEKEQQRLDDVSATVQLQSSSSEDDSELDIVSAAPSTSKKRKRGTKKIVTMDVASALDRSQLSDRKAALVLAATASSLGHNIEEITVNRSSIRRARIGVRSQIAEQIREAFEPDELLTVHWDGKILPDLTGGNQKVDRLPVLVSGANEVKLLGVPKLPSGTGKSMADAVLQCLDDWGIKDRIKAMSFDTTASNTGNKVGSCILIEESLDQQVLHLACRHHIFEIVAENIYAICSKASSTGPDIKLFQRFQSNWDFVDKEKFETCDTDLPAREEIIEFCQYHLHSAQPRDDYRELLELTIIYLGGIPNNRGIHFMQPGALHRARWMARIIYAIKICLFRSQFKISSNEVTSMKRFADFAVTTYVRHWILASSAVSAPSNDLSFLKMLISYPDKDISDVGVKAFSRHQWYLSETLVSLSFFDDNTPVAIKREMIKSLSIKGSEHPQKRINIADHLKDRSAFADKTLANFVTSSSLLFFDILRLSKVILEVDPIDWKNNKDYQTAKQFVSSLKVVNDTAERAVALMQAFNSILTKNEDQKQYLLQLIEQNQRRFPDTKKATIIAGLNSK